MFSAPFSILHYVGLLLCTYRQHITPQRVKGSLKHTYKNYCLSPPCSFLFLVSHLLPLLPFQKSSPPVSLPQLLSVSSLPLPSLLFSLSTFAFQICCGLKRSQHYLNKYKMNVYHRQWLLLLCCSKQYFDFFITAARNNALCSDYTHYAHIYIVSVSGKQFHIDCSSFKGKFEVKNIKTI